MKVFMEVSLNRLGCFMGCNVNPFTKNVSFRSLLDDGYNEILKQ